MRRKHSSTLHGTASAARRRGFTLLEVILSVSLAIVLLSALYAALHLHLTFAQRGPERVHRSQTARAIVERIAEDVRAIVQPAPVPKDESSTAASGTGTATTGTTTGNSTGAGGTTTGTNTSNTGAAAGSGNTDGSTGNTAGTATGASGSTNTASSTASQPNAYRDAFGVLGGTDWLQLYVAHERADLDDAELSALGGSVARVSNVLRVTYSATVLATRPDARGRTQRLALARTAVAAIGAEQFDTSSNDSDFRATTDFLCDDMALVQFQYWDDATVTWLDSWGVDAPIAPPRAIKVTISLLPPEEYADTQLGLGGGISTWQPTFSLVIPVPTWVSETESSGSSTSESGG